jgi:O-antigen biosynthesis protein WbqP
VTGEKVGCSERVMEYWAKKHIDVFIAVIVLGIMSIPLIFISIAIKLNSKGPALHWSRRIGIGGRIYLMPKLRTMVVTAPNVATDQLKSPHQYVTSIGSFLRRTSIDELPQFWCVLKGEMSVVGPRPALFSQQTLTYERAKEGILQCRPGITGWAQVNGRDCISDREKVLFDKEYLISMSLKQDLKIVLMTVRQALTGRDVSH